MNIILFRQHNGQSKQAVVIYVCKLVTVKSTVRLYSVFRGDYMMENVPSCCQINATTDVPDVPNGTCICIFNNSFLINKLGIGLSAGTSLGMSSRVEWCRNGGYIT